MSDENLSDKDILKLFNQTSKALRDNDTEKLESIFSAEAVGEEAEDSDESKESEEEEESKDADSDESEEEDSSQDKNPPANKTEETKEDKAKDSDDIVKLREQLAKLEKDNHSLRSQAGRVPHVQRRLQELDKKLEELKKGPSPSSQLSEKVIEKLKGIKETDEELANAVAAAIAEAMSVSAEESHRKETETLQFLREQEQASQTQSELDRLVGMYPNAVDVFQSPSWKDWKQSQSRTWQMLATSDSADDVSEAFEKYARDMLEKHPELNKQKVEDSNEPTEQPEKKNEKAEKIEAERDRKKTTTAVVNNPKGPAKVSMPDDPDALFKKFSEQIRKERTG